jgi:SAM-dependent methyltransferase
MSRSAWHGSRCRYACWRASLTTCSAACSAPTWQATASTVRAAAEQLPFADRTFDLAVVTMSLRHWTDPAAGIAQIDRVLILGGVLVVADVLPACRRRGPHVSVPWRRGHIPSGAPAELAAVLTANELVVVGCDRMPWFRLPDIHVIAAQKPFRPHLDQSATQRAQAAANTDRTPQREEQPIHGPPIRRDAGRRP